jgi:hypothetical protein
MALAVDVMQLVVASLVGIVIWVLIPVNTTGTQPSPDTYFLQLVEPSVLILRCDRNAESREGCKVRARMEKVRTKKG